MNKVDMLNASLQLANHLRKQMGDWMFARYCKNLGIPPEDCYYYIFKREPRISFELREKI
jgi:hypothetical protein